jgi:hypothetical protein
MKERFLEAIPEQTERKLAGPGRPGTVDAGGTVERWEALRLALGAHGCLAVRGGFTACLQGCLASILAPPTAPSPRAGRARDWQTSDAWRRENAKVWLFETVDHEFEARRFLNLSPLFCGERSTRIVRCASGEGRGTAHAKSKTYRVGRSAMQQARPASPSHVFTALPRPSPEAFAALRLRPLPARAGRG